ncbi:MAG TPA: hypothetical protein VNQ79_12005 [Blastocatellia bacterium]|nr:hypothetical protein [Blastocatellia bacterium]
MSEVRKLTPQEIERHTQQIVRCALVKVNPSFAPDEPAEDETDLAEAYQEKVSELLPGDIFRGETRDIEVGETVYSVKKLRTRWAIYRCQPVNQENPLDLTVSRIGAFPLAQAADRLLALNDDAELGLEMDDILSLLDTDSEELFWLMAEENLSKKGEYLGSDYVQSWSGSWHSDWAIQQNADGTWSLWAVFEPEDVSFADPEPELMGTYPTREEALARVGKGWNDEDDDQ